MIHDDDSVSTSVSITDPTIWTRYGYKKPCDTSLHVQTRASSQSTVTVNISNNCASNSIKEEKVPTILGTCDARTVLVTVLFPLFIASSDSSKCSDVDGQQMCQLFGLRHVVPKRGVRLERLMLHAAAHSSAQDLDRYLADDATCLVSDLIAALRRLPVRVMIS